MLWRYVSVTSRSALNRLSASGSLLITAAAGLLLLVGCMFWLLGALSPNWPLLGFALLMIFAVGLWGGLSYVTTFRPNSLWWLRQSDWLWLKSIPTILVALFVAVVTLTPFYLARYHQLISLEAAAAKISLFLIAGAVICLGLALTVTVRRLTRNPYLRLTVLVLALYAVATFLLSPNPSAIHLALQYGTTNSLLIVLLFSVGIFGLGVALLQAAFDKSQLATHPNYVFWNSLAPVRLLNQAHHPAVSYFLTQLAYYVRSSYIHRRVIAFFVLAFTLPYLLITFGFSFKMILAFQLLLIWLLAQTFGNQSGQLAAKNQSWLRSQPISFNPRTVSIVALLAAVITFLTIGQNLFPVKELTVMFTAAISIAVTTFWGAEYAHRQQGIPFHREGRLLTGSITSLAFVILPLFFFEVTTAVTSAGVMLLWLTGVTLYHKLLRK